MTSPVLHPGDVVRIRDERWSVARLVPGSIGTLVEVRGRDRTNRGIAASFLLPCEPCERLPCSTAPRVLRPRAWLTRLRAMVAATTPAPDALRTIVTRTLSLLPYQLEPALAVVSGVASRILIADEVGLGKTVQAGFVLHEIVSRRSNPHVLIVSPAGLRSQWQNELRDRIGINAAIIDSLAQHAWTWHANPWAAEPVIIVSLDYIKRPEVIRSLEALIWDVVVFDEAHALAGPSDRAAAARALSERARTVLLLTATPHSGDDEAFERLCAIGDLQRAFPLLVFRRTRDDVGLSSARHSVSLRVRPTTAEAEMHRRVSKYARLIWLQKGVSSAGARLAASVLCRRACSSAASLARSVERRLAMLAPVMADDVLQTSLPFDDPAAIDDEPAAELATPGLHDAREERRWLQELLDIARLAARSESKLRVLGRFVRRARQPALVFTEYRDTLVTLASALSTYAPLLIHGGLTAAERHEAAMRFNAGDVQLLLATDAASEGLNLQRRCRLVINLELPWTPWRLEQRIGRVERLGQTRRVHAVHLLAAATSEETSVAQLVVRSERAARALNNIRSISHSESEVASAVIGDVLVAPRHTPATLPDGLVTCDLRELARTEAARLEMNRSLEAHHGALPVDHRPCLTLVTRRGHAACAWWIHRLDVVDRESRCVWETLIALTARTETSTRAARHLRAWLDKTVPDLASTLMSERDRAIAIASLSIRRTREQALRRERAIRNGLAAGSARLSASLLQGGLFDRRGEHAAAAQQAIVEAALARSTTRLQELEDSEDLSALQPELVLALIAR